MILVLLVGPDLISQDLRFNAIPLYLSRPVRRFEYFLGKLGVIAVYLSIVTILPALVAIVLGFGFSLDPTVIRDTARILFATLAYGAIVVVSAGTLMLAFSSLSRNSRYVGAMWLGLWLIGNLGSGVLTQIVRADWCPLVSYTTNLQRVRDALFDADTSWNQVTNLFQAGREQIGGGGFPRPFGGRRGFRPRPPAEDIQAGPDRAAIARERRSLSLAPATYPWTWSAGVLAALGVLSAAILTTQVRSLDRLK
jgi:ABC-2 type transport system permease protein